MYTRSGYGASRDLVMVDHDFFTGRVAVVYALHDQMGLFPADAGLLVRKHLDEVFLRRRWHFISPKGRFRAVSNEGSLNCLFGYLPTFWPAFTRGPK